MLTAIIRDGFSETVADRLRALYEEQQNILYYLRRDLEEAKKKQ